MEVHHHFLEPVVGPFEQELAVGPFDSVRSIGSAHEGPVKVPGIVHARQIDLLISSVRKKRVILQSCVIKNHDWVGIEDTTARFFQQAEHTQDLAGSGVYIDLPLSPWFVRNDDYLPRWNWLSIDRVSYLLGTVDNVRIAMS